MHATSEFSVLTTDDGLRETLVSAEEQNLYARLAATDLGLPPVTIPHSGGEVFEDSASSEPNEGPEDHWLDAYLFGIPPASESPDGEFSDSSNNDDLELNKGIFAVPVFPTLLSDKEIDALFEEFGAAGANPLHIYASSHSNDEVSDSSIHNIPPASSTSDEGSNVINESFSANAVTSLHINTSGHSDSGISDSSTHSSQELDGEIFSHPTPPASPPSSSTSDEGNNMLNGSFDANAIKPSHVDGIPAANTESIDSQHFKKQPPELLRRRPTSTIGTPRKMTRTRARRLRYSMRTPSRSRTTQWKNVWIRVENASIECGSGEVTEYRATQYGWRKSSSAGVIDQSRGWVLGYTGTRGVQVYPGLNNDKLPGVELPGVKHGSITYLDVRVKAQVPIRIMPDEKRGTFSGYDEAGQKYLRVGYKQVRALIERPEQSIMLKPEKEE